MSHVEIYREATFAGFDDEDVWQEAPLGKWRWRFVASNGKIMADSGQGYSRRIDCLNGFASERGGVVISDTVVCFVASIGAAEIVATLTYIPIRDLTKEKR